MVFLFIFLYLLFANAAGIFDKILPLLDIIIECLLLPLQGGGGRLGVADTPGAGADLFFRGGGRRYAIIIFFNIRVFNTGCIAGPDQSGVGTSAGPGRVTIRRGAGNGEAHEVGFVLFLPQIFRRRDRGLKTVRAVANILAGVDLRPGLVRVRNVRVFAERHPFLYGVQLRPSRPAFNADDCKIDVFMLKAPLRLIQDGCKIGVSTLKVPLFPKE